MADLDQNMAWIRRANSDGRGFLAHIGARFKQALPDQVVLEEKREGFFSSTKYISSVSISLENSIYIAEIQGKAVKTVIKKRVRGIIISSQECSVEGWMDKLKADIERLAINSSQGIDAFNLMLD